MRCDRSVLPLAISRAPVSIDSVPLCTARTIVDMLSCMRLMPANRRPISLRLNTLIGSDRSPAAMRSKYARASLQRLHDQAAQREADADHQSAARAR